MKNKINRVCILGSVYSLLIYLLYSSEDELKQTYYFFSFGIDKSIRNKFSNHCFINIGVVIRIRIVIVIVIVIRCILLFFLFRIFRDLKWPFLKKSEIFGNDNLLSFPFIAGKCNYICIEEQPKIISKNLEIKKKPRNPRLNKGIVKKLLYKYISDVFGNSYANNKQCEALLLTENDDAPYITGKIKHIISLDTAWNNASEKKKEYILSVFDVSGTDVVALQCKTHIILTQPLSKDGYISEEEQIHIYRQIIEKYSFFSLVIKVHPRDTIDYRKYFSDIFVFDKPIPMQLLLFIGGLNFKKAITLFSTSINYFPDTVEKEWIGTSVHPILSERLPYFVNNPF